MPSKSPEAFRTIGEVADDLGLPQHVLRFWETRFTAIRPLKRGGGRRYYRPDDVDLVKGVQALLYGQGYTIKGVQRIIRQSGVRTVQAIGRGEAPPVPEPPAGGEDGPEEADEDVEALPETERSPQADRGELRPAALARLKGVLDELFECERILAGLRADLKR